MDNRGLPVLEAHEGVSLEMRGYQEAHEGVSFPSSWEEGKGWWDK